MWQRDLDDWFKRLLEDVYEQVPPFDLIGNSPFEVHLARVAAARGFEAQTLRRISFLCANNLGGSVCGFTEREAQYIHVDSVVGFNKVIYSDPRRLASQFRLREWHVVRALDAFRGSRYDVAPLTLHVGGGQFSAQATVEKGGLLYRTNVYGFFRKRSTLHATLHVMTSEGERLGEVYIPNVFLDLCRGLSASEEEFARLCQAYLEYTGSIAQWILDER